MYAVLSSSNAIVEFDNRDIPLNELIHEDFIDRYIEISEENTLKFGDIWNKETQTWEIIEAPEQPIISSIIVENQPTDDNSSVYFKDINNLIVKPDNFDINNVFSTTTYCSSIYVVNL